MCSSKDDHNNRAAKPLTAVRESYQGSQFKPMSPVVKFNSYLFVFKLIATIVVLGLRL